jgi:hypothetical protein
MLNASLWAIIEEAGIAVLTLTEGLEKGEFLSSRLTRAQRSRAVMLIDEADVYIKRRDDDIAMAHYEAPDHAARRRIWQVMPEQFGLRVDDALLEELVALFPRASSRDIKGLAKLTAKYCSQKQLRPSAEAFKRCSVFRAMEREQAPRAQMREERSAC